MEYKGQEKVKILEGQHKGVYGYVRIAHPDGFLWIILDNGHKTRIHKNEVEFIRENYFLDKEKIEAFLKEQRNRK